MIGAVEQLLDDLLIYREDQRGIYYCGCGYVPHETHCPQHGDPVERWPGKAEAKAVDLS